jgi:CHAT domain-containing protein
MKLALQLTGLLLSGCLIQAAAAQTPSSVFTVTDKVTAVDSEGNELRDVAAGVIVKRFAIRGELSQVELPGITLRSKEVFLPTESLRPTMPQDLKDFQQKTIEALTQVGKLEQQSLANAREGKWTQALENSEQAFELLKVTRGDLDSHTLLTLGHMLAFATNAGDLEKAHKLAELLVSDQQLARGTDSIEAGLAKNSQGLIELRRANFDAADSLIQQAVAIYEKAEGPRAHVTLDGRCDLGLVAFERGKFSDALSIFENVLAITEKDFPDDELTQCCLFNLAALASERSDYRTARSFLDRGLAMKKSTDANQHGKQKPVLGLPESMDRIVGVLISLGEFEMAFEFSMKLLEMKKVIYGPAHLYTGRDYERLGTLASMFSDPNVAIKLYFLAMEIYNRSSGKDNPNTSRVLVKVAEIYLNSGNFAEAKKHLTKCISAVEAKSGTSSVELVASLRAMGATQLGLKEQPQAIETLSQGLKISRDIYGDQHPQTIETLRMLGIGYAVGGDWKNAVQQVDQARRHEHEFIWSTLPFLDRNQQDVYFQNHSRRNMESDLGWVEHAAEHPALVEKTLEWILNYKSVATEIRARQQQLLNRSGDAKHQSELQELIKLRQEIGKIQLSGAEGITNKQYFDMRERERKLIERVMQDQGSALTPAPWLTVAEFRQLIPADGVYLEIARFVDQPLDGAFLQNPKAHYGIWIVWPDETKPVEFVKISFCSIFDRDLARLLKLIRSSSGPSEERTLKLELHSFYKNHLQECFSKITKAKQVVISPDTAMWVVPWPALMVDDETFMVEQHSLTLCMSGRDLQRQPPAVRPRKSVIVADPDYDQRFFASNRRRQVLLENMQANRLPGTRIEAKLVAPIIEKYTGSEPVVVLDADANETKIKKVISPQILTFATHGFFISTEPMVSRVHSLASFQTMQQMRVGVDDPLNRCGLMLAGCNEGWSGEDKSILNDGVLTGVEVLNLQLAETEIVVLSACETGLGNVTAGEGIAGLRQSFHVAGARSVVASLWPVPDKETVFLMAIFYDGLAKGKSKGVALQSAQVAMINAFREGKRFPHPALWAAFNLTESSQLTSKKSD